MRHKTMNDNIHRLRLKTFRRKIGKKIRNILNKGDGTTATATNNKEERGPKKMYYGNRDQR